MIIFFLIIVGAVTKATAQNPEADLILHNGKVVTVNDKFKIAEAIAVRNGSIIAVGTSRDVLKSKGSSTKVIDLQHRTAIPGLIDAHVHPVQASQSEFYEPIPDVHTITELLHWISNEASKKIKGEWIIHPKFFITRMLDMRQLTIHELDSVAPNNPVFLNGSFGGMVNTKALRVSKLFDSKHQGILRFNETGAPLGLIHQSIFPLLAFDRKVPLTKEQQLDALKEVFKRYNNMGITSVCSGGGNTAELSLYEQLMQKDSLTVRVYHNLIFAINSGTTSERIHQILDSFGRKSGDGNDLVKVGALKIVLDGGVLTGTAYLREGWGSKAQHVYGISDPSYRGNIFFTQKNLEQLVTIAADKGWKFTAHATGGGGVDTLLAAFSAVNKLVNLNGKRFSIIHGNFFTAEALDKMATMGIYADMQPAWYLKDAELLNKVLGSERISTFHPYRSMLQKGILINGGSDHMVKLDANTSINPYNPFLAMWSVVTRKTERGSIFNREQAVSREEALKMYTINNAKAFFEEKIKGSIEVGKLADITVLSDDLLTCAVDSIRQIKPVMTIMNGRVVYHD